jgi:hypothetical protein
MLYMNIKLENNRISRKLEWYANSLSTVSSIPNISASVLQLSSLMSDIAAEQAGTGQPATRPESKSEGSDKPQPEAEGRFR